MGTGVIASDLHGGMNVGRTFMAALASLLLPCSAAAAGTCDDPAATAKAVESLYLAARFPEAREAGTAALACRNFSGEDHVALLLRLAEIEDRIGLNQNARPVAHALELIGRAEAKAASLGDAAKAAATLARAEYLYRAGIAERSFAEADALATAAEETFAKMGDKHGEADAVHLRGLIRFQQRSGSGDPGLDEARRLFDRSLALDIAAGARKEFCGDYHRHVGYIDYVRGDLAGATPHFRASVACRRQAGAVDATMFGPESLAASLSSGGVPQQAFAPILEGLLIAEAIGSPVGTARLAATAGHAFEAAGEREAACRAFTSAVAAARSVALDSVADAAGEASARLCNPQ